MRAERVDDGGERCRRELVVVVELDQDVALRNLAGGELGGAHPANPGAGPLDPHPVVSFGWCPRTPTLPSSSTTHSQSWNDWK